ncbi:MAG: hypothetical protein AAFN65_03595 [Bacteroidota bacterium]
MKNTILLLSLSLLYLASCSEEIVSPDLPMDANNQDSESVSLRSSMESGPPKFFLFVGATFFNGQIFRSPTAYFKGELDAEGFQARIPGFEFKYNNGNSCKIMVWDGVEEFTTLGQSFWTARYKATSPNGVTANSVGDLAVYAGTTSCSCGGGGSNPWLDYDSNIYSPEVIYVPSEGSEAVSLAVPRKTTFSYAYCF